MKFVPTGKKYKLINNIVQSGTTDLYEDIDIEIFA